MEKEILKVENTTFNELVKAIADVISTTTKEQRPQKDNNLTDEYVTRDQAKDFLHINLTTLHRYTKNGLLKSYQIGKRVLYKKTEIQEAVQSLKQ